MFTPDELAAMRAADEEIQEAIDRESTDHEPERQSEKEITVLWFRPHRYPPVKNPPCPVQIGQVMHIVPCWDNRELNRRRRCVVQYINAEHRYYTVMFDSGVYEGFKF